MCNNDNSLCEQNMIFCEIPLVSHSCQLALPTPVTRDKKKSYFGRGLKLVIYFRLPRRSDNFLSMQFLTLRGHPQTQIFSLRVALPYQEASWNQAIY